MKFVAIVTRTLKPGKSYEDYRKAWFHSKGFGTPATMYTVINVSNPREIISIGVLDLEPGHMSQCLETDVQDRLAHPLDDVIESTVVRTFGVVAAVDDFSPVGELSYMPPQVDGRVTDWGSFTSALETVQSEIREASLERDRLKREKEKQEP